MRTPVWASVALAAVVWSLRPRSPSKHKWDDKNDARQQEKPDDGVVSSGTRIVGALESILKEYKTRNAKADRHRPEDQASQQNVARWVAAYTVITGAILAVSGWQSVSVQRQLNTALVGQRSWLSLEPEIAGPIKIDSNGMHFALSVTVKNVGHAPASKVSVVAIMDFVENGRPYEFRGDLSAVCDQARKNNITPLSLFPDQKRTIAYTLLLNPIQISRGRIGADEIADHIIPFVNICVTYDDLGGAGENRRTALAYTIAVARDGGRFATIPLHQGDVLQETLRFDTEFFGGSLAE